MSDAAVRSRDAGAPAAGGAAAAAAGDAATHELLTVDVWDTLLRRRCHPDCVKLHVGRLLLLCHRRAVAPEHRDPWSLLRLRRQAEKELGEQCRQRGFDDEYRHRDVYARWLELAGPGSGSAGGEIDELVTFLEQVEMAQERFVSYADPAIAATLATCAARQTLFLSDFYLPASAIRELLALHELDGLAGDGLVSCEVGLNKRSGRLYSHLHRELGVRPQAHLHIGDNPHSDVAAARELGIASIHYLHETEHRRRLQLEAGFAAREAFLRDALDHQFGPAAPAASGEQAIREYGRHCSPLLIGFALAIIEQAVSCRAERVFFFTREGEFFRQIYRRLAELDVLGVPLPPADLLQVSRLASFAASLRVFSAQELMRIWNQYSVQSLNALLVSLGLRSDEYGAAAARHAIDPAEPIRYPWLDPRMLGFIGDRQVRSTIEAALDEQRAALLAYLKSAGFPLEKGSALIVDIGWRGTIQDNLAHALPRVSIDGLYLGLNRFLNPQPANAGKTAYGPDLNRGPQAGGLLDFVAPLEMLCNSPGGSVRQYRRGADEIEVIREIDPDEDALFHACARHFQQGVLESIPFWADFLRTHAYTAADLRPLALEHWRAVIDRPPAFLARAYFKLKHNESFGVGGFDDKRQRLPTGAVLLAFVSRRRREAVNRYLQRIGWIPGILACPDVSPVFRAALRVFLWARWVRQRMSRARSGA